ncbi:unnamed protein product [Euphydryas editha]|uniref:Uncharacterized protein n=1 Tax=Euphydryas editha TaxID=104508 RepID=A0AAU9TV93_EUPED|nr:unnamed protein product [Euphydryas editha]
MKFENRQNDGLGSSSVKLKVHEKVNEIESKIFKEIEEREKEKTPTPKEEVPPTENNVTNRRVRPRNTTEQSPAKKAKVDDTEHKSDEIDSTYQSHNTSVTTKRITRTPKKAETADNIETTDSKVVKTRQTVKKSLVEIPKDSQEDVRYKFPSPAPKSKKSITNKTKKDTKNTRQRKTSR